MNDIENKIKTLTEDTIHNSPYELVDVRIGSGKKPIIQIFIDKPGGINVEDCVAVSRNVEKALDEADVVKGPYSLEVSSPGIERPLVAKKDYEKYVGSKAKVRTKEKIDGQKNFLGLIVEADDEGVTLSIDSNNKKLNYKDINRANLVVEFE